jgi:broad specificity phosphatase PhoE
MRLLLIRHAQTLSNVNRRLDTSVPGPGLTELGYEQAGGLPNTLAGQRIDAIYVSNMVRTHLTAQPLAIARGLQIVEHEGLREIGAGIYDTRSDGEARNAYITTIFGWVTGDLHTRMPGAENGAEVFGRFNAVITEAAAVDHHTVAFVSHSALIRSWVAYSAFNVTGQIVKTYLDNAGVVVLDGDVDRGWTALSWMGKTITTTGDIEQAEESTRVQA